MRRVKVQASKTNKDRWINQAEGDARAIKGEPNLSIWRLLPTYLSFIPFVSFSPILPRLWSHPNSFHRNPHTSRSQHPRITSHIRLSAADRESLPTKQNTISHTSVHVQTYITQTVNQNIALLKAVQRAGVICIRKWQAQSFILRPMCFLMCLLYGLDLIWKGKVFIFQQCEKSIYAALGLAARVIKKIWWQKSEWDRNRTSKRGWNAKCFEMHKSLGFTNWNPL